MTSQVYQIVHTADRDQQFSTILALSLDFNEGFEESPKLTIAAAARTRRQPAIAPAGRVTPSTARSKKTPATGSIRDSRLPTWDLRFAKPIVFKTPPIPTVTAPKAIKGERLDASTEKEGSKAKGVIRRQLRAVPQKAMANSE